VRRQALRVNLGRSSWSEGPQALRRERTSATSHVGRRVVLAGGLWRKTALINLDTSGCAPTGLAASGWAKEEMADLCRPMVPYTRPLWYNPIRYSRSDVTEGEKGSRVLERHQLVQAVHAAW